MGNLNYFSSGRASADAERVANSMSRSARPVYLIHMRVDANDYQPYIGDIIGPFPDSAACNAFIDRTDIAPPGEGYGRVEQFDPLDSEDLISPQAWEARQAE